MSVRDSPQRSADSDRMACPAWTIGQGEPCGAEAVARATGMCEHEHLREGPMCSQDALSLDDDDLVCSTCYELDGHLCALSAWTVKTAGVRVTAHLCSTYDPACYRCELSRDELDAHIDAIHGPGAARAIEEAYADGSIFSDNAEPRPKS